MPMVWYIPPLSPVVDVVKDTGYDAEDKGNLFAAIDALRIPVEYLAELFTAGDVAPGRRRAAASSPRCAPTCATSTWAATPTRSIPAAVGMTGEEMYDMYRLLAIAKYDERYVIPPAHAEQAHAPRGARHRVQPRLRGRPRHGRLRAVRRGLRRHRRRSRSRTSRCCRTGRPPTPWPAPDDKASRVNLLNWDGKGAPPGLFPPRGPDDDAGRRRAETGHDAPGTRRRPPPPGSRVAAARLPRRASSPPSCRCWPPRPNGCPAAAGDPLRRFLAPCEATPTLELARRLRRDLRPPAPLLPLPHLLRARRHPQARRGAAGFKRPTAAAGPRARPTTSCPTTSASCWSTPAPSTRRRPAAAARPPGRARAAAARPGGRRLAVGGRAASRHRDPAALGGDERDAVRRLAAEGPPRRRSGSRPSRRRT